MGSLSNENKQALGEIGRRLNEFIRYEGLSKEEVGEILDVSPRSIGNIMGGNNFDSHLLVKINRSFPLLNINWLVLGEGAMTKEQPSAIYWQETLERLQSELENLPPLPTPLLSKQAKERTKAIYGILDQTMDLFFHITGEMVFTQSQCIDLLITQTEEGKEHGG